MSTQCYTICWQIELQLKNIQKRGSLGGAAFWRLPLAQGAILETWDRIPRWSPCMEPASPSAYVSASLFLSLSLCVTIINKLKKKVIRLS